MSNEYSFNDSFAKAVRKVRAGAPLDSSWSDDINADYQYRSKTNR